MNQTIRLAVVMPKGGTGKSTLTTNIATVAQEKGHTVLIIDTDPQVSACNWADRRGEATPPQVVSAMPARLEQTIASASRMGVDFVIIDTPPLSGDAGVAAAIAADIVISPCGTSQKDVEALDKLANALQIAATRRDTRKPPECLIVMNAVSWLSFKRQGWARAEIEKKGFSICPQALTDLVAYDDADKRGLSVTEYEPDGRAAGEIREVYKQISQLIGELTSREADREQYHARRAG